MASVLGLALILATLSAVDPLFMKYLIDQLGRANGAHAFGVAMVALLALELVRAVLQWCLGVWSWDVRLAVEYTVRERVVSKLNSLPLAYHEREGVGSTMNRINQGINGYVSAFSDLAFNLLPTILYLGLSVFAMFRLDWRLALGVIVFTPIPALIGALAAPEQIRRERRLVERWSSIYGRFNEVLAGMMTVKGFGMEDAEKRRLLDGVREGNEVFRRGVRTDEAQRRAPQPGRHLCPARCTRPRRLPRVRGPDRPRHPGRLPRVHRRTLRTGTGPHRTPTSRCGRPPSRWRASSPFSTPKTPVGDGPDAANVRPLRGEVQFRSVSFGYQPGVPVLRDIDLTVRPGETVALVGRAAAARPRWRAAAAAAPGVEREQSTSTASTSGT